MKMCLFQHLQIDLFAPGELLFKLKGSENKIDLNMNKVMMKCSFGSAHLLAKTGSQYFSLNFLRNNISRTSPFWLELVHNISKNDLRFRIWIVAFMSSVPVVANAFITS